MASLTYGNKYFVVKSEKETSREGYNIVDVLCDVPIFFSATSHSFA